MSPHGTNSRYTNGGCRCGDCRAAATATALAARRNRDPATLRHGEVATYKNYGCRCDACREANRVACADYRARRAAAAT